MLSFYKRIFLLMEATKMSNLENEIVNNSMEELEASIKERDEERIRQLRFRTLLFMVSKNHITIEDAREQLFRDPDAFVEMLDREASNF